MPELPEVETVRRGLSEKLKPAMRLLGLERSAHKLRFRFPTKVVDRLAGQDLVAIERRAKYLLFKFERDVLVNHLGMTGSWRPIDDGRKLGLHEHVSLRFGDGAKTSAGRATPTLDCATAELRLIYHDPRRFGYFDLVSASEISSNKWFQHLGPEPLEDFTGEYLFERSRKGSGPIKNFIMNQKIVVGVGNIYASEALFVAGLSPLRPPRSLSRRECDNLVGAIRQVLQQAIEAGGTTIRDFVALGGELGAYHQRLKVYGRGGESCERCGGEIEIYRLAGRSTYGCPHCQK